MVPNNADRGCYIHCERWKVRIKALARVSYWPKGFQVQQDSVELAFGESLLH